MQIYLILHTVMTIYYITQAKHRIKWFVILHLQDKAGHFIQSNLGYNTVNSLWRFMLQDPAAGTWQ